MKFTENGIIRSSAYDFLLTFHSNHGPVSYRFRDRRRFQSKIAKFSHPLVFSTAAEARDCPWNWAPAPGSKTRMVGLPGQLRGVTYDSSVVWIQCTNVTDRRTNTARQQRPRLRIASRGKKNPVIRSLRERKLQLSKEETGRVHQLDHVILIQF